LAPLVLTALTALMESTANLGWTVLMVPPERPVLQERQVQREPPEQQAQPELLA
jgi:hypothetical protein